MSSASATTGPGHTPSVGSQLEDMHSTFRRPRSLFPQRRSTLSTIRYPLNKGFPGYPADENLQAEEDVYDGYEKDYSDDGSSSSSGTVKIAGLSKLGCFGSKEWHPMEECCPVEQRHTEYPMYHADKHLGEVVSQKCPPTPGIMPKESKDTLSLPSLSTQKGARKVRINSRPKICGSETVKTSRSLPNLRAASQQHDFGIRGSTCSDGVVHQINSWDASIQLYVIATMCQQGEIKINYHARVLVALPKQTIDAENVCLKLAVNHGFKGNRTYHLDAGHSSLYFGTDAFPSSSLESAKAQIAIIGNVSDMDRQLDFYFAVSYLKSDPVGMQVLPSFRPESGKVLSESVILGEPAAPLAIDIKKRSMYSSWEAVTHPISNVTQFRRIDTPPLYPLGLRDDLRIGVTELLPVRFQTLGALTAADVVWDLDIKIQQTLENELECRMSMYLEVPVASNKLVTIDSHRWVPGFFLADGSLATEQTAQWRQRNEQLTLFKQTDMLPGPIKLELTWHEPSKNGYLESNKVPKLCLPSVLDRKIVSGSIRWKNTNLACLASSGTEDYLEIESDSRLPTLEKGYKLHVHRTVPAENSIVQEITLSPISKNPSNNAIDEGYGTADDASNRSRSSSGTADPPSGPDIENLGMQRPTLSPIIEGRSDNASNEEHTALDNDSEQSSADADSDPGPDLEAHDDPPPPGREEPREEVTNPTQTISGSHVAGLVALFLIVVLLFVHVKNRSSCTQSPLPDRLLGVESRNWADTQLSREAERGTPRGDVPAAHLELERIIAGGNNWAVDQLSREAEGGRSHGDVPAAHLGLERIMAGAEVYDNQEEKGKEGWFRRARNVFDYGFGWPGPM